MPESTHAQAELDSDRWGDGDNFPRFGTRVCFELATATAEELGEKPVIVVVGVRRNGPSSGE